MILTYEHILTRVNLTDLACDYDGDVYTGIQEWAKSQGLSDDMGEKLALYLEYKDNKQYWTASEIRQVKEQLK